MRRLGLRNWLRIILSLLYKNCNWFNGGDLDNCVVIPKCSFNCWVKLRNILLLKERDGIG